MTSLPTNTNPPRTRRGRPPGTRAQQAIRLAATQLFAERGFGDTSLRDIAAAAGVDPALVVRHFGSKDALFLQTMSVHTGLPGLMEGTLDTLGRSILRRMVEVDDSTQAVHAALIRALDREDVRIYLAESSTKHIVEPLAARLIGRDREIRARLVAAQVSGLLTTLWVVPDPMLDSVPAVDLLDIYARPIQALIDPPADAEGVSQIALPAGN